MHSIIRYVFLTALRDWLFVGLLFSVVLASGISLFLGSTALSEQTAMQLSYVSGSVRLVLVVGMILFICFHIRRAFENREIEFNITKPISRSAFLFAYFLSFSFLAALLLAPVLLFIMVIFSPDVASLFVWGTSLYLELILISSFAILASLILNSAVSAVLSCFGFYIVSRMMGFAVAYIIIPGKLSGVNFNAALEIILKFISIFLPRLDLFVQSKWLIYGIEDPENFILILSQAAIYIPLILFMSFYDFNKKQF